MPYVIEWDPSEHKSTHRMYFRKDWGGWTSDIKDADTFEKYSEAARAINRSGCGMEEQVKIVAVGDTRDYKKMMLAILEHKDVLPLLMGIHSDLDQLIDDVLGGSKKEGEDECNKSV